MPRDLPPGLAAALEALERFEWPPSILLDDEEVQADWNELIIPFQARGEFDPAEEESLAERHLGDFARRRLFGSFRPVLPVVSRFFAALTEAGAQGLLASRAGLDEIDPARWPSPSVRYGPLELPEAAPATPLQLERSVGGPHRLGARLLWWCAAAADPVPFGYSGDLTRRAWEHLPWVELRHRVSRHPMCTLLPGVEVGLRSGLLDAMQRNAGQICAIWRQAEEPTAAGDGLRPPPKPRWDRERRQLWFGEVLCREYRRTAQNQSAILDAFEAQGWPPSVADPLRHEASMRQAIADLNRELSAGCPVRFGVDNLRPAWHRATPAV